MLSNSQFVVVYLGEAVTLVIALVLVSVALLQAGRALMAVRMVEDAERVPVYARDVLARLGEIDRRAVSAIIVPVAFVALSGFTSMLVQRNPGLASAANVVWLLIGLLVPVYVVWESVAIRRAASEAAAYGPCLPDALLRRRHYRGTWGAYGAALLGVAVVTSVNVIAIVSDWSQVITLDFLR